MEGTALPSALLILRREAAPCHGGKCALAVDDIAAHIFASFLPRHYNATILQ